MDRTAIHRFAISAPLRHLLFNGVFTPNQKVLDYGCGLGYDACALGFDAWDPNHRPDLPKGWKDKYDIVLMTYVLCILPEQERYDAWNTAMGRLKDGGFLYAAVRADIKEDTKTQYVVHGDVHSVYTVVPELSRSGSWRMYRFGA